jgi:hypothetical protein
MPFSLTELEGVFQKYPTLTPGGLAVTLEGVDWHVRPPPGHEAEFKTELRNGRDKLRERFPAIAEIASWLVSCPKLKVVNYRRGTGHGLKHVCEHHMLAPDYSTYVSNGEFIAAAILAGFTVYADDDGGESPNCGFNMSERWIKKQEVFKATGPFIDLNEWALQRHTA